MLGFLALITPLTPGSWLIFVGAEILGMEIIFAQKIVAFFKPQREQVIAAFCLVMPLVAGVIGGILTAPAVASWYVLVEKPIWTPPNYVFGPVWTLLYLLMGLSAYLVWQQKRPERMFALKVFFVHLVINVLWSVVFFGLHSPLYGLVVIVALWAMIVWLITLFVNQSRAAAWILVPYLLWVTYAASLNLGVFFLN